MSYRPWPSGPFGPEPQMPRAPSPGPLVWPYILGYLLLSALALPAIPTAVIVALALRRSGWRSRWLVLAALAVLVVEVVWWRESLALLHFSGWATYGLGAIQTGPGQTGRILALLHARMVCEAPVGVPLGILAAAAVAAEGGRQGAGAPWHPATVRQRDRAEARDAKRIGRRLDDPKAAAKCSAPPLAVARDGDLAAWRQGDYVVQPRAMAGRAVAVAGRPGMGKTVAAGRLVAADGAAGRRIIFLDAKGTDPGLAWSLVEAWQHGAGYAPEYRVWPASALDGWRGDADELANRLLAGQEWSDAWYKLLASRTVRLACQAPGGPPSSSKEFLVCLTAEELQRRYAGTDRMGEVQRVTADRNFAGVELRFANYFDALRGRFDGDWSWDDGEVLFLRMQALAEPEDRAAAFGYLCADIAAWATTRKARIGDPITVYVDEFSAVSDGAWHAIDLAERLRDVGVGVVFLAQSWEGFGPDELRQRLLASCAALVVLGMDSPEPLLRAAGTIHVPEQTWQLDHHGPTGSARLSMAEKPLIDPNAVRRAEVGEAWVISGGRYLHGQILRASALPWPSPPLRAAAAQVTLTRAEGSATTAEPGQALERRARPLAALGGDVPGGDGPAALPAPRLALVARQMAAHVQAEDLAQARELAEAFGLGLLYQAMVEAREARPARLAAAIMGALRRWWP